MKLGDTIQTTVGELTLEDRVLANPSAHQWEPGWWAFIPGKTEETDPQYFISDDGHIYSNSEQWPDVYDVEIGTVIRMCRECDGPIHGTSYDVHESCRRGR